MIQAPRLRAELVAALFTTVALSSSSALAGKERVPDTASLKARVAQLYEAHLKGDQHSIEDVVLPQLVRCSRRPDDLPPDPEDEEEPVKVIAWKIKRIQYDGHYVGQVVEMCPGQTFQAAAGALVIVSQTDQSPGKEPETGDLGLRWVYVDNVWYTLLDDD